MRSSNAFLWIYSCFANSKIWFRFFEMYASSFVCLPSQVTYAHSLAFGFDLLLLFFLTFKLVNSILASSDTEKSNIKWISSRLSTHITKTADAQKVSDLRRIVLGFHRNEMEPLLQSEKNRMNAKLLNSIEKALKKCVSNSNFKSFAWKDAKSYSPTEKKYYLIEIETGVYALRALVCV